MSRARTDYAAPAAPAVSHQASSHEVPIAGFYRTRLAKGGAKVGVRIWHGAPLDPVTGEELDRSHRWQAQANGAPIAIERVWPWCASDPIDEREYRYLIRMQSWAQSNAPDSGLADPSKPLDLRSAPIPI